MSKYSVHIHIFEMAFDSFIEDKIYCVLKPKKKKTTGYYSVPSNGTYEWWSENITWLLNINEIRKFDKFIVSSSFDKYCRKKKTIELSHNLYNPETMRQPIKVIICWKYFRLSFSSSLYSQQLWTTYTCGSCRDNRNKNIFQYIHLIRSIA